MAKHHHYSNRQKAAIVRFYRKHGYTAMMKRYEDMGSGTVYAWLRAKGEQPVITGGRRRGPPKGRPKFNGQTLALTHLTHYAMQITNPPTDRDLDVLLAIRALQGKGT